MLAPEDIRREKFSISVLGGYKREDVDAFFRDFTDDYEKLYNENAELVQKLKICVNKIEEYRKDEQFLKTAIVNAEKLNETTLREIELREKQSELEAKKKAESIVQVAKSEAENIVNRARIDSEESIRAYELDASLKIAEIKKTVQEEEAKLEYIKKEVSDFKENLLKIYKQHLSSITKLPSIEKVSAEDTTEKEDSTETVIDENINELKPNKNDYKKEPELKDISETKTEKEPAYAAVINNEKTAEFVIEKKPEEKKTDRLNEIISNNIKFKDLKFGTDFDLNKDE